MIRWSLAAHQRTLHPAGPEEVEALLRMRPLARVREVHDSEVLITTGGVIGTRAIGPVHLTVWPRHVSPSVALGMVLHGSQITPTDVPGDPGGLDDDFFQLVATLYGRSCRSLFRRGLRREYAPRVARMEGIRGSVDLDRWWGPDSPDGGDRPWCRFRERVIDLPEHRVLRSAFTAVARSAAATPALRDQAAAFARRMDGIGHAARFDWNSLRNSGLFASYREPLALARVLLEGLGGEGDSGESRGFLLNIDRRLETWIADSLRRIVPDDWNVGTQEPHKLARAGLQRFLDVTLRDSEGRLVAILDAKNKDFEKKPVSRDDVHQMVSYLATTGCRHGYLVGFHSRGPVRCRRRRLRGARPIDLCVVSLPGMGTMDELADGFDSWATNEFLKAQQREL